MLLGAACAGRGATSTAVPLPATAHTGVVAIEGPTLVGFFPPPTTAMLGDSVRARRLEAFHRGLDRVRAPFERAGVRVYEQYTDTLAIREGGAGIQIYVPPVEGEGVGYYLGAPGRAPEILRGLHSEDALRDAVWRYFHAHGVTREALR